MTRSKLFNRKPEHDLPAVTRMRPASVVAIVIAVLVVLVVVGLVALWKYKTGAPVPGP